MYTGLNRFIGLFLIGAAVAGFIFSLIGLIGTWVVKESLTQNLQNALQSTNETLSTTIDGLTVTDRSLTTAIINLNSLRTTLQATGRAINNTTPMVSTLTTLMAEDLPHTITTTQTSLITAQSSAQLIENVLTTITSFPLVPGEPYRPSTPLHVSLGEVSESLEPLVESFESMESSLRSTRGNMILIEAEFNIMARQVDQINASITSARLVVNQYKLTVTDLQEQVDRLQERLPVWMDMLALFLSFGFVWLAITQVGLFMQGLAMMQMPPAPASIPGE